MKRFTYKARDKATGNIVTGNVQAENERAAGKILIEQGYAPLNLKSEEKDGIFGKFQNRITAKQRITFTRQFATLIGAGLPLSASLRMMAEQTEEKPVRAMTEEILAQVEGGKTLYQAFSKYPDVFNKVYLSLIQAGEFSKSY